ncbi:MAG: PKD domain-containing protein, partial [Pedobacter sp.]
EVIFALKEKGKKKVPANFSMKLLDANPFAQFIGEEKMAGKFIYNAVSEGVNIAANQYKAFLYKGIYAGIDLRFKVLEDKGIEYEFIVHPGANVNDIKIKWTGAENISQDGNGAMIYQQQNIQLTESKPISFSEGRKIETNIIANEGVASFNVTNYDRSKELIIDPVIQWSTYYGSYSLFDAITKVLTDRHGNVYAVTPNAEYDSWIVSPDFDSINLTYASNVIKFDSSGNRCWATFMSECLDMSVDDSGNVYLLSIMNFWEELEPNKPYHWYRLITKGTHQTKILGLSDAFIVKLDSAGYLKWGTLYGGDNIEVVHSILAKNGSVYIAGETRSSNNIATNGGGARSLPDAFLAKLGADGKRIFGIYITTIEGLECVADIDVDEFENIYVCGSTTSKSGIATSGAFQTRPSTTDTKVWDGFLAKYDKDGKKKWGTFYSKSSTGNIVKNVSVDKNGNVYIYSKASIDYKNWSEKSIDSSYIARFDSTGKKIWEVRLKDTISGDGFNEHNYYMRDKSRINSWMEMDDNGNIAISGYITYPKYHGIIPSANALKKVEQGQDGYYIIYNSAGQRKYASYFGGKYNDEVHYGCWDSWGGFYLGGLTFGNDLHTKNAYDTTSQYDYGYSDGFLARLKFDIIKEVGLINVKANEIKPVCENSNAELKLFIKNYGWKKIDSLKINWKIDDTLQKPINWTGFVPAGDSIRFGFNAPLLKAGTHKAKVWISNGDAKNDTIIFNFVVNAVPPLLAGKNKSICSGDKAKLGLSKINDIHYQWRDTSSNLDTLAQIIVSPAKTTTYYLTASNIKTGCTTLDSVVVTVNPLPLKAAGKDKTICAGEKTQLGVTAKVNYSYSWFTSAGIIDSTAQPIVQPNQTTTYYVKVTDTTGCFTQDTLVVNVNRKPQAQSIFGDSVICEGGFSWYKYKRNSGETINWEVNGMQFTGKPDADSILIKWDSAGKYIVKATITSAAQCKDSTQLNIEIYKRIIPSFTVSSTKACANESITFTNKTKSGTTVKWLLPDGTTDSSQTITKAFSSAGTYVIWLKSTTLNGCADSVKQEINIYDLPGNEWKIAITKPGEFSFKASDSIQANYKWYFGTGDSSTSSNTNYKYVANGNYKVSIKISNSEGCQVQRDTLLSVSGIVSVKEPSRNLTEVDVYPNPFTNKTTISYSLVQPANVRISLYDINGKAVYSDKIQQAIGIHQYNLNADDSNMQNGIYLLKVEINTVPFYQKIVKVE